MARFALTVAAGFLICFSGCSKLEEPSPVVVEQPKIPVEPALPTMAAVDQALKAGSFDDAAARLLEMRTTEREFSPQEAADYRRKLNEAYSAALEAAEKGDSRAKAAIEMIRASPGR